MCGEDGCFSWKADEPIAPPRDAVGMEEPANDGGTSLIGVPGGVDSFIEEEDEVEGAAAEIVVAAKISFKEDDANEIRLDRSPPLAPESVMMVVSSSVKMLANDAGLPRI